MNALINKTTEKINAVLHTLKQEPFQFDPDLHLLQNSGAKFRIDVKKNLTTGTLQNLLQVNFSSGELLITEYVSPQQGELLRNKEIQYADTAGNMFIRYPGIAILVSNCAKPRRIEQQKTVGRAFTTTGLKLLFLLLTEPAFLSWNYRKLAQYSGVSLGSVRYITANLQSSGLMTEADGRLIWRDFNHAVTKWCDYYQDKLLPGIEKRHFTGNVPDDIHQYPILASGESAAEELHLLKSRRLLAYRSGNINLCIARNRWVENTDGNIEIRTPFWPECRTFEKVPDLLIYADLLAENDSRCTEAAGEIFKRLTGKNQ